MIACAGITLQYRDFPAFLIHAVIVSQPGSGFKTGWPEFCLCGDRERTDSVDQLPRRAEELATGSGKTKIFSRGVAEKDREERKRTPIQTPADRPRTPRKAGDRVS